MQGEPVESTRRLAVPAGQPEEWRRHGVAGIDAGLRERDDDPRTANAAGRIAASRVEHRERAGARAAGEARPFGPQEVALMAAATSPATGEAYGVKRVCTIWGVARSSFYHARHKEVQPPERPAGRRGPKPALGDEGLLATSAATWRARRGPAKGTARSGRGCG